MSNCQNRRDALIRQTQRILQAAVDAERDANLFDKFAVRFEDVVDIRSEFNNAQANYEAELQTSIPTDETGLLTSELENQENIRDSFNDTIYSIKSIYNSLTKNRIPQQTFVQSVNHSNNYNVRLPKLSIPTFSGDIASWKNFEDLFQNLVHQRENLSNIEKFQYLKLNLTDEPLVLIKNLPVNAVNYNVAWEILKRRYDNNRLIATHHIERILELPAGNTTKLAPLKQFVNALNENLAALKVLNLPVDSWSFLLLMIVGKKLDRETRTRWERTINDHAAFPKFSDLLEFLENQILILESVSDSTISYTSSKPVSKIDPYRAQPKQKSSPNTFVSNTKPNDTCALCRANHYIYHCPKFRKSSPQERFHTAKQNSLCINCLHSGHASSSCPSSRSCLTCQKRHHSLLHFSNNGFDEKADSSKPAISTEANATDLSHSLLTRASPTSTVILATAIVMIKDTFGENQPIRALLDCASQSSYISESCAQRLGLSRQRYHTPILALGGVQVNQARGRSICHVSSKFDPTFLYTTSAIVIKCITNNMPTTYFDLNSLSHIKNLKLADPECNIPAPVDMLIGAEMFPHVLHGGRISDGPNKPVAVETVFGWVLMGETPLSPATFISTFTLINENSPDDATVDGVLRRFWEIEEVAPAPTAPNPEETKCENIFEKTVERAATGRYTVPLPFRSFPPVLGNSYNAALKCLNSLQNRLRSKEKLKNDYIAFMEDYINSGHMSVIKDSRPNFDQYYIPHHCVLRPDSTTTKLRVVFNASKPTTNGVSLNDVLLTGPALQQDIVSILLRARFHAYLITADIRQMYRQILVRPEHRPYQRILWNSDFSKPAEIYQLNTVTYGLNCAPYLALRTLRSLANDERSKYPKAAEVLDRDTYVDDIITGCDTLENAISLQTELSNLLASGGFELRKWSANDPKILEQLPDEYKQLHVNLALDKDVSVKILGLRWCPSLDKFSYNIQSINKNCTKRIILSEIARIFDPLGWLSPLSMSIKILIQYLWALSLDWDSQPPKEVIVRWETIQNQLPSLTSLTIDRFIPKFEAIDLIGFCDASSSGYAAVIYTRSELDVESTGHVALLCAKTRVAPIKRISIPRLELCAALLLSRLLKSVLKSINPFIRNFYAFSDSTVALAWIRSPPHKWKTFVSNRTTEIQSVIAPNQWFHVRSADNSADCASRGLLPHELLDSDTWFHGPSWLSSSPNSWPTLCSEVDPPEVNDEIEVEAAKLTLVLNDTGDINLINKYSSFSKLQRVTAYCLRFIEIRVKKNPIPAPWLTTAELENALTGLIKLEQHAHFSKEMSLLLKGQPLRNNLRKLNPFIDECGILRVGGRLRHSLLNYNNKHPIILPKTSRLTSLIIDHYHALHLHPGPHALQAILHGKFWIMNARSVIRNRLRRCHVCFRCNPQPITPFMGDLPLERTSQIKPFSVVGVDYGGPFQVTYSRVRGVRTHKAYLCLFVCFSTKAVHLELASNLSTEAFLAAFRRLIARRGRCSVIHSDCGTNFVGARRKLSELFKMINSKDYNDAMSSLLTPQGIDWRFNPPSAPHFGGLWEAGIKSVKKHLLRVIGEQILTYEELNTVLVEIEALLNSRPLCPLSSDPNDFTALTPGHFLMNEAPVRLPEVNLTEISVHRLSRWELVQRIQQHFWKRWHNEYLNTLQQRQKWISKPSNLNVGRLVLVKDETQPPLRWRLGRVESVVTSADGIVRAANVRVQNGILSRPVVKLCPLPDEQL